MGGAAEDLKGQSWIHPTRSFFQKADVLIFSLANSAKRSPETDADAALWLITGIFQAGVIQREFGGSDGELGVAIQSLQTMRREKLFRCPPANFTGAMRIKTGGIESGNVRDSAVFRQNSTPEILLPLPNAGDWTESSDDATATPGFSRKHAASSSIPDMFSCSEAFDSRCGE